MFQISLPVASHSSRQRGEESGWYINKSYKSIDLSFMALSLASSPFSYLILQCQPSRNRHSTITILDLENLLIVDLLVPL